MHTYGAKWPDDPEILPDFDEFRFNDASDLAAFAELDRTMGWKTWPDVWHLDAEGEFSCYFKGSSLNSLPRWAEDPSDLYISRREGLRQGGCADRWVIIETRHEGMDPPVSEGDARAFVVLRRKLQRHIGVTLVDAVVFDDQFHWWSMQELTSGSTRWPLALGRSSAA